MREALLERLVPARAASRSRFLSGLLQACGLPPLPPGSEDPVVTGIAHDSRAVQPGDVFVAIRGSRDGADFAASAAERGAVAVVAASPERTTGVPWIEVADDRAALADLAAELNGRPSEKLLVLGITGTNGKTTSTHLLAAILSAAGGSVGRMSTVEAAWPGHCAASARTTAEATDIQAALADMADAGCAACALEVSSHGIDLQRIRGTRFRAVAFTNLSQDHLDWYGDLESYYRSKRRLFLETPDAPAAICVDDAWGERLAAEIRAAHPSRRIVRTGFAEGADLRIAGFEGTESGCRFRLVGSASECGLPRDADIAVELRLPGAHNARNAAIASALALLLEAPPRMIVSGLASFEGVAGRLERVDDGSGGPAVFVDYAHTPAALEGVLTAARAFTRGRLACVFGCGGDKDREKRPLMGEAVARLADVAIVTSDNPRGEDPMAIIEAALQGARRGGAEIHAQADRRAAIALALRMLGEGDVLVIAGKGHETCQEIAGRRIPFDDRRVAREILAEIRGN